MSASGHTLTPLTDAQVKAAITTLLALHSIAPVEGEADTWRIVEEYGRI